MSELELKEKLLKELGLEGKLSKEHLKFMNKIKGTDGKEYFWHIEIKHNNGINTSIEGAIDMEGNVITDDETLDKLFV